MLRNLKNLPTANCVKNRKEMLRGEMGSGSYNSAASPASSGGHQSYKTKRIRTSFTHNQQRTLDVYFGTDQNPDANDLEQLKQKTGLSKRVLQVWFQNARAKLRKKLSNQKGFAVAASGTVLSLNESLVTGQASTVSENSTSLLRQQTIDPPPYAFPRHPNIDPPPALPLPQAGFKYWR